MCPKTTWLCTQLRLQVRPCSHEAWLLSLLLLSLPLFLLFFLFSFFFFGFCGFSSAVRLCWRSG